MKKTLFLTLIIWSMGAAKAVALDEQGVQLREIQSLREVESGTQETVAENAEPVGEQSADDAQQTNQTQSDKAPLGETQIGQQSSATSLSTKPAPVGLFAQVSYVFSGYQDGSVLFVPEGLAANPAECDNNQAYVMPKEYNPNAALGILLTALTTNRRVYLSVLEDVCHTPVNSDLKDQSYPVVQRVGVEK